MSQVILISCQQCGYESPDNARFCRHCGAALLLENESSAADTRNYGRQEAAQASVQSAPLNPSVAPSIVDAFGDPTRRQYAPPPQAAPVTPSASNTNPFYHAPVAPQYGYAPPQPARKKLRWLKWAGAVALLGCVFGIGIEVGNDDNNAQLSPAEFELIEGARREGRLNDQMATSLDEVAERSANNVEELISQIESARDEARNAAENGSKIDVMGIPPLDLDKYEFEEAVASSAIRIPGKEMREQLVNADFDVLLRHYEKLLGKPLILQNVENDEEKRVLFQSPGTPEKASVSVLIKYNADSEPQWKIVIVRSPFSFPRSTGVFSESRPLPSKVVLIQPPPPPPPPPPAPVEKIAPPKPNAKSPQN